MDLSRASLVTMNFTDTQHSHFMLNGLLNQKTNQSFCDVKLRVNDKLYAAHRCVLAAGSAFFGNILQVFCISFMAYTYVAVSLLLYRKYRDVLSSSVFCFTI